MTHFTWKEDGLTNDCQTLEAMASRYEESAKVLRKMSTQGFELVNYKNARLITHKNKATFDAWGFISEASPFLQLNLISKEEVIN